MHWIQCYKGVTVIALEGRSNLLKSIYCVQVELGPNHKIQHRLPVYFIQTIVSFILF